MYTISYENLVSAFVASLNREVLFLDTYTKSSGFLIQFFIVYRHHQNWKRKADFQNRFYSFFSKLRKCQIRGFPLTPTIVILSTNCWQLLNRTDCLITAVSNLKRWRRWTTESKTTHGRVGHAATVCSCVRPQAANSCGVISLRQAEALIRTSAKCC